jgi:hypothetical protein
MKWSYRIAQVFTPGLVRDKTLDLKGRPNERRSVNERNGLTSVAPSGRTAWDAIPRPEDLGYSVAAISWPKNQPIDPTPIPKEPIDNRS